MNHGGFDQTSLLIAKDNGRSSIRLFTAAPTPLEQRSLGTLFAICEIDSTNTSNEHLLDLFIDEVTNAYYASESVELDSAFEYALQKLNQKIAEACGELGEDWLKTCNMIIGVHKDRTLLFTHIGRVIGMLFVKEQMMEIIDSSSRIQELNPLKFFSNIVSGDIPSNARVLLATESMMDYLSRETVRRIASSNDAAGAVEEFTELLSVDTADRNFVGYVFEPVVGEATPVAAEPTLGTTSRTQRPDKADLTDDARSHPSADSMSSLMNREQQTADLLTSSLWPSIKKSTKEWVSSMTTRKPVDDHEAHPFGTFEEETLQPTTTRARQPIVGTETERTEARTGIQSQSDSTSKRVIRVTGTVLVAIASGVAVAARWVGAQLQNLYYKARGTGNSRRNTYGGTRGTGSGAQSIQQNAVAFFSGLVNWFTRLTVAQKIFVIVAVVVFVIFAQSVFTRGTSNSTSVSVDESAQIMSQVDVKINEGKAAELVNGDARAKYIEARDLLATIPKDSKIYKQRGAELEKVIADELKATNKIKELGGLSPVVDFGSIAGGLQVRSMILLGSSVYAFDANNGSAYRGNLENGGATVALSNASADAKIVSASKASVGTGLVVQTGNKVGTFNPVSEAIADAGLSFGTPAQNIVDVALFGTRVYTLDTGTNQIVRNRKEGAGFVGGENWLTDTGADVRSAVNMAIDGSIYVLNSNGTVNKFDAGKKSSFALSSVDPALSSGVALSTDENTTNIYIADAQNKRVVVFDKKGTLVQQYTSDSFDGMTDIIADEANKRILVLTQNGKVLKIDL